MKTLAFFNNKGGVGKTSLVYHLGWMFAELGQRVIVADFDPQATLTSVALKVDDVEGLWDHTPPRTIHGALSPLILGHGDVQRPHTEELTERLWLVPGDLALSTTEDRLSGAWQDALGGDGAGFRLITALRRGLDMAADGHGADLVLIDVGPSLGALNRAALVAADAVIIPVVPDRFSIQGLRHAGECLRAWRRGWSDRRNVAPAADRLGFELPSGAMAPIGYVISRQTVFAGGRVWGFPNRLERLPSEYRRSVLQQDEAPATPDPCCLGMLKDYRSLAEMAHEARKPMFKLKPADGAMGGHQSAAVECYFDHKALAERIRGRLNAAEASHTGD